MRGRVEVQQLTVVVVPLLTLAEPRCRQLSPIRLWIRSFSRQLYTAIRQYKKKLLLSRTAFRPHNLLFYNTNLSTLNQCNSTELTLHVLTNCQHVSLIMLAKSNHVATVVAGIDMLVKALSLLRLHCYHQWNEGFECSLQQHSKLWQTLAKQSCKIQSNLD